jgi:hypothetical protein
MEPEAQVLRGLQYNLLGFHSRNRPSTTVLFQAQQRLYWMHQGAGAWNPFVW